MRRSDAGGRRRGSALRPTRAAAVGAAALALAGCTSVATSPDPAPRARCLSQAPPGAPAEGPRPLIFLLCIQSP